MLGLAALVGLAAAREEAIRLTSGGVERTALLHVPDSAAGKVPLVVDLHAWGSMNIGEAALTDFTELANEENFAVVYPEGYDLGQPFAPIPKLPLPGGFGYSWNAGGCCPHASTNGREDVQFIRDLVSFITSSAAEGYQIDTSRVYATGMSNGGFMTNRLSCEARDLFAAIAPVSGILVNSTSPLWGGDAFFCPNHEPPLPVLHFHGTADIAVPWDGNRDFGFSTLPEYLATRLRLNGLSDTDPGTVSYQKGSTTCTAHGPKASNVTLCKVQGGGHSWPGSKYLCPSLPPMQCNHDIDATRQIWDFFKQYSLKTELVV